MAGLPKPLDAEKGLGATTQVQHPSESTTTSFPSNNDVSLPVQVPENLSRWNRAIQSLKGLEARGIGRVPSDERGEPTMAALAQVAIMWYSANITLNNLAVGFLGPLLFDLGFLDSALVVVFACLVGSVGPAYMAIWGPQSGNRTMVVARYFMGYWPAKLTTVLNIVILVGYSTISCIVAGQVLSAVGDGKVSVIVGIVIIALICWAIAVFGMKPFHVYERVKTLQTIILFILCDYYRQSPLVLLAAAYRATLMVWDELRLLRILFRVDIEAHGFCHDLYRIEYLVHLCQPSRGRTPSGVSTNAGWDTAYKTSSGALVLAGFEPLGGFGKFCGVVVALGVGSNVVPSFYGTALDFQVLGKVWKGIPRYLWVTVAAIICLVCGVAGRDQLFLIFQNFLALMGYWLVMFIMIVFEEHVIFQRNKDFDWAAGEDRTKLPVGIAALMAFLVGWVGPILGMYQVWWTGPVARLLGDSGADLGIWLAICITAVVFPPVRFMERRWIGR
ncbi:MAG: hypothetical protein Q9168_002863 [Polycauliona sp. 1 TL-2023]